MIAPVPVHCFSITFTKLMKMSHFNEQYLRGEIQVMFEELNVPITVEEVRKGLKHLKYGASAGPDLILIEFLKHGTN